MIKIIMDSGKEYNIEVTANELENMIYDNSVNGAVRLKNIFISIPNNNNNNIIINPSHISSMEK